jgi:hypothetical protein
MRRRGFTPVIFRHFASSPARAGDRAGVTPASESVERAELVLNALRLSSSDDFNADACG